MTNAVKNKMPVPAHMSAQEITDFYEGHISKAMTVADAGEKYLALANLKKHLAMHGEANTNKISDALIGTRFVAAAVGVTLMAVAAGGLLLAAPVIAAAMATSAAVVIGIGTPSLVGLFALGFASIQNKIFSWSKNKYASKEVANDTALRSMMAQVMKEMKTIETQTPVEELQKSPVVGTLSKMKAFTNKLTGAFKSASNPANDDDTQQSAMKVTPPTP